MKWFFLLLLIQLPLSFASDALKISGVTVNCADSEVCKERRLRFNNLAGDYRSLVHLKNTLGVVASDGGYQSFTYRLFKQGASHTLEIDFVLKPVIREISVGFTDRTLEVNPSMLMSLKEGEYFEIQRLNESISTLQKRLDSMGYPDNEPVFEVIEKSGGVDINVVVTLGRPRIFRSIKTNASSTFVAEFLRNKFYNLYNRPFELNRFKIYLDSAQRELFNYGYYLINLDFTPEIKGNRVILDIKVQNDRLFAFDFRNHEREDRDILQGLVVDLFRKYKRPLPEGVIRQALLDHYRSLALLNVDVEIQTSKFTNMYKESVSLYRVLIHEKAKTRLKDVNFIGNSFYGQEKLRAMFESDAFELASIGYFDEEYFKHFVDLLRTNYIKNGFVQVRIQDPVYNFSKSREEVSIDYIIQENQRAYVRKINFEGLPGEFEEDILSKLRNRVGEPFNPISLVDDIRTITEELQDQGYYYAEVSNSNEDNLVQYSRTGADVDINFVVSAGQLVRLNRVLLLGNNKTKKKVLMKKIVLEPGEVISPAKTREIESKLSSMGLFNSVQVEPLKHNSKNNSTDLLVRVSEREYGLVEVAPGYRTDLGLKLTGTVSYMNIGGMNRSLQLRAQINQRLDFDTIDPRRRKDEKHLLEYNTSATFIQGDMFDTLIDYSLGVSQQRRRFYSFDADIQRINNTFTRDLTRTFSMSIRHQLEKINQWNATNPQDNGSFRIGSITPSITWDLRNSQINPVSGAFFNLSAELANPYFLSQQTDDLTINYYKLISRNRFYIPFKNGTVAISLAAGMQENIAKDSFKSNGQPVYIDERDENGNVVGQIKQTQGYIPNIKVFRLTGMDIVRGFDDSEINRLEDGRDISLVRVQNKAYMTNFKFEPRYFLSDSLMAGIFFDAGRVYVDKIDLDDLRTSAGLTIKVVTPVGTLDFDYGLKLLRKKLPNGRLEDPGRFHVSIGFF